MRIKAFNPYWEREWEVNESKVYFEQCMKNILCGNETFIMLTTKTGVLSLSPKNLASIEVMDGDDGEA